MTATNELRAVLDSRNVQAFLRVIRAGESSQDGGAYRVMFGGSYFESFADHPRQAFKSPWGWTSAAGAYQAMCAVPGKVKTDTWGDFIRAEGPHDFSPASQDAFAVWCIKRRGALQDVLAGRIESAIAKCAKEWASLPGSPYGQPTRTLAQALATYRQYGGLFEPVATNAPAPAPSPAARPPVEPQPPFTDTMPAGEAPDWTPPVRKEDSMPIAPIIAAVLPSLIEAIPKLGKVFGSGSEVADRNIKAAELVVETVKAATGAVNAQDAAERVKSDPAAARAAAQAVDSIWYELTEAGGGGVDGARRANAAIMESGAPAWKNPAFVMSLILVVMPMMLLIDVLFVHPENYTGELRVQIVTAVLAVIAMVAGYWIGTSFSSARKDERRA